MDSSKLSIKRDKDIIIPRALYATTKDSFSNDIKVLEEYYSKKDIVQILKHTKENISNQVCELVSNRYNTRPFYRYAV
jgi:site-specific recombinase XerD